MKTWHVPANLICTAFLIIGTWLIFHLSPLIGGLLVFVSGIGIVVINTLFIAYIIRKTR